MHSFSVIVFLLVFTAFCSIIVLLCGKFLSPSAENKIKNSSYEYGMQPVADEKTYMHSGYFVFVLVFFVFTVQLLLLFPFALAFEKLQFFVFLQTVIFLFIMVLSLGYAIQKNMLRLK